MSSSVRRTYSTRTPRLPPSSPPSELASSPPRPALKRKRPLVDHLSCTNTPTNKKPKPQKSTAKGKQKTLTQLHFNIETSVLKTCPLCDLTYTRGAPDDESLHRSHCTRVQKGLEWGKEEEKESKKAGVEELASDVRLKNGSKGRIISFRAEVSGRTGNKLQTLLDTINLTLSSPPLSQRVLQASKVYLFLLQCPTATSSRREKIVGCVIAQRISTAMAIVSSSSPDDPPKDTPASLISVDPSTNLYVCPKPLPTPMGIPRLFVSSSHRRLGIASRLLTIASETFILGCPLDPSKGDVAFTQPTGAGKSVLENWGKGGVRIYEE